MKIKCVLCRKKIELKKDKIYQVEMFTPSIFEKYKKTDTYDAIDCSHCGTQNILKRRIERSKDED